MLVTQDRTLFVPWETGEAFLRPWFEYGVISADAGTLSRYPFVPATWEGARGAVVISHDAVARLECRRARGSFVLEIEFRGVEGVETRSGFLNPSRAYIKRNKGEGVAPSASSLAYAQDLETIYRRIPTLATLIDWHV